MQPRPRARLSARMHRPKVHDAAVAKRSTTRCAGTGQRDQRVRRPRDAAPALQACRLPDHDHRLVPADAGSPQGPRRARQGRARATPPTRRSCRTRPRARSAGRRTSASTCWCMASSSATTWCSISASSFRASSSQAWLGAVLWLALRAPAGAVRRRVAAEADDGRVVAICAVADRQADEGDADRAGRPSSTGRSCATISRAATPAGRSRSRSATRSPISKTPAPA